MDSLSQEQEKLSVKGSLSKSVGDVQKIIDLLLEARNSIASSTSFPAQHSGDILMERHILMVFAIG